jgi:hypothetical protein
MSDREPQSVNRMSTQFCVVSALKFLCGKEVSRTSLRDAIGLSRGYISRKWATTIIYIHQLYSKNPGVEDSTVLSPCSLRKKSL